MMFAVLIILLFIMLSGSRGPLVACFGMIGMGLLLINSPKKATVMLVLLIVAGVLVLLFNQKIVMLISNAFVGGFSGRFTIWETSLAYISQYPFFGHGSFAEYTGPMIDGRIMKHTHSMILGLSFYWGIPAALIYIATVIWGIMTVYAHRDEWHMSMAGCILVFGFIGVLTDTFNLLSKPGLDGCCFFFGCFVCL